MDPNRRLLACLLLALPALAVAAAPTPSPQVSDRLLAEVLRLEQESGGRLGVAVFDAGNGTRFHHRGDERFPMCSTFKLLLVAAVLARVDAGDESLTRRLPVRKQDLVSWAPFSETRVGADASVQ